VAGISAALELWGAAGMQLGGEDGWQEFYRAETYKVKITSAGLVGIGNFFQINELRAP
jgi:hypothetical protein